MKLRGVKAYVRRLFWVFIVIQMTHEPPAFLDHTLLFSSLTRPFVHQNKLNPNRESLKWTAGIQRRKGVDRVQTISQTKPRPSALVSESYFGLVWPSCISVCGVISIAGEVRSPGWRFLCFVFLFFAGQHASDTTLHGAAEHQRLQQEPVPDQGGGLPGPLLSWQQPGVWVPGGPYSSLAPNCWLLSRCERWFFYILLFFKLVSSLVVLFPLALNPIFKLKWAACHLYPFSLSQRTYIFTFLLSSRLFIHPYELMSKVCHLCMEQQRLGDPQADKVCVTNNPVLARSDFWRRSIGFQYRSLHFFF